MKHVLFFTLTMALSIHSAWSAEKSPLVNNIVKPPITVPDNLHRIDTKINPTDGTTLIWVPGNTFTMGNPCPPAGLVDCNTGDVGAHQVTLTGFWMDKNEVTVARYRAFCQATGHAMPNFPKPVQVGIAQHSYSWNGKAGWDDPALQQHPIVNVNWNDAGDYAKWAGLSLPTEAQWEYAARGTAENNYPWGGLAAPRDTTNGWNENNCANIENSMVKNISTWKVGSFRADVSWCGVQDMGGNVGEWCSDWFAPYWWDKGGNKPIAPQTDPTGPPTGTARVARGGTWERCKPETGSRATYRMSLDPKITWTEVGFRCISLTPGP